jgi:NTE family protein
LETRAIVPDSLFRRFRVPKIRIGLALSSGIAKSVAHVGVIRALQENGIGIDYLSGTSGGAIVAALYAGGKSISEMERIAERMQWWKLAGLTLSKLGFLSGDKIAELIIKEIGDVDFKDLNIPTAIVAADLTGGVRKVFKEGRVAVACQASSSIPQIFHPVELKGHSLVDGALVEHLPVETLHTFGKMFSIGVDLGKSSAEQRKKPKHIIEIIMQVTGFVSQYNSRASQKMADFLICPDLSEYNPFALQKAGEMMEIGYRETIKQMDSLAKALRAYGSLKGRMGRMLGT